MIAVSQLLTTLARDRAGDASVMAVVALAGDRSPARLAAIALRARKRPGAPIVVGARVCDRARARAGGSGRPTFSSYMVLADSAVHMIGADYLIRHGQHFAHLDLRNSYGQFINAYYNTDYPSGADTLFGGERDAAADCR